MLASRKGKFTSLSLNKSRVSKNCPAHRFLSTSLNEVTDRKLVLGKLPGSYNLRID